MFCRVRTLFAAVLALSGAHVAHTAITDCGAGKSVFQLTELAFTPTNPSVGVDTVMTVKFDNPGPEINDGTVTTSISWNYIPFEPSKEALCTNTQCPLVSGANDRSTNSPWPDISGLVQSHIEWTDVAGNLLLCIDLDVQTSLKNATKNLRGSGADISNKTAPFELLSYFHRWQYQNILEDVCYVEDYEPLTDFSEDVPEDLSKKQIWKMPTLLNALIRNASEVPESA
jgi:hypothetical protein